MKYNLLGDMKEAVKSCGISLTVIAGNTGVSRSWMFQVMNGRIRNPGVLDCERVMNWIEEQK
jgi:predicted transcriptional regulator